MYRSVERTNYWSWSIPIQSVYFPQLGHFLSNCKARELINDIASLTPYKKRFTKSLINFSEPISHIYIYMTAPQVAFLPISDTRSLGNPTNNLTLFSDMAQQTKFPTTHLMISVLCPELTCRKKKKRPDYHSCSLTSTIHHSEPSLHTPIHMCANKIQK